MSAGLPLSRTAPAYVVGVTGHMDLGDEEAGRLKKLVTNFFKALQGDEEHRDLLPEDFPALTHTPIVVLSSLAPGADTIVAEAALDLQLEVRAPLPFPKEIYSSSTSFRERNAPNSPSSLLKVKKYKELLQRILNQKQRTAEGDKVWMVRLPEDEQGLPSTQALTDEASGRSCKNMHGNAQQRRRRYEASGEYVALHCNILLALWDRSAEKSGKGGSSDTAVGKVEDFVPGVLPKATGFTWNQTGAVVQFPCRRISNTTGAPPGKEFEKKGGKPPVNWLYPGDLQHLVPSLENRWNRREDKERRRDHCKSKVVEGARHLNDFNRLAASHGEICDDGQSEKTEQNEAGKVLSPAYDFFLPETKAALDLIGQVRRRAANATGELSGKTENLIGYFFLMAFISAFTQHFWAHFPFDWPSIQGLLAFATICIVIRAWCVHKKHKHGNHEQHDHDWRVFAEALRVQLFWAAAGIDRSVAASYMQRQRAELDWIRRAVSSLAMPYYRWNDWFAGLSPGDQITTLETVRKMWLEAQKKYFINSADKHDHQQHAYETLAWLLVSAALVAMAFAELGRHKDFCWLLQKVPAIGQIFLWVVLVFWLAGAVLLSVGAKLAGVAERNRSKRLEKKGLEGLLGKKYIQPCGFWQGLKLLLHRLFPPEEGTTEPPLEERLHLPAILRRHFPDAVRVHRLVRRLLDRCGWREPVSSAGKWLRKHILPGIIFWILVLFVAVSVIGASEILHTICHPLMSGESHGASLEASSELNHFSVISVGLLILAGALAVAWREVKLFAEHSRQYHTMANLFISADIRMQRLMAAMKGARKAKERDACLRKIQELLRVVGREALDENAEWLILHRSRPLEPVLG